MDIKVNLSLSNLEFECIRTVVMSSAASIHFEFKDMDCSSMNEFQATVLSLADKFNNSSIL